jgi:hypothetical protein
LSQLIFQVAFTKGHCLTTLFVFALFRRCFSGPAAQVIRSVPFGGAIFQQDHL